MSENPYQPPTEATPARRSGGLLKILGGALIVFGVLMFISAVNLALTKYDLHTSLGVSGALGGFVGALLITAGGLALFKRGQRKSAIP
jgi:membrane associated rhomboid family serine protease